MTHCPNCPYGGARCGSRGPSDALIIVVGEAPGDQEIRQGGIPFVGPSGVLLTEVIRRAGGEELPILYTNAMQCQPPSSAEPYAAGIAACRDRLFAQINEYPRRLVIATGNSSLRALIGRDGITKLRGQILRVEGLPPIISTFHPSAVLRAVGNYRYFAQDLAHAIRIGRGAQIPATGESHYRVIRNLEEAGQWVGWLKGRKLLAMDIETTGLSPRNDRITYVGISWMPHQAVIFPAALISALNGLFDGPERPLTVWQNGKFDTAFLRNAGVNCPLDHDTLLLHLCLNEQPGTHGLKQLANDLLGSNDYEDGLHEHLKKTGCGWGGLPEEILLPYLAKDCDYTYRIASILLPQVEADPGLRNLYYNVLLPASRALQEVERAGIWLDTEKVQAARIALEADKERAISLLSETGFDAWDADLYRRETGVKTNVSGPTMKQVARYNFGRQQTIWFLERLGRKMESLNQKSIKEALASWPEEEESTKFLSLYSLYLQAKGAVDRMEAQQEAMADAEKGRLLSQLEGAKGALENWERVYWKPAAIVEAKRVFRPLPFSPGSYQQVRWVLGRLGVQVPDTTEATLTPFGEHPFVRALLDFRGAAKALSTYVEGISKIAADEPDGRVHATYLIQGTVTGRLSSAGPNMQNIPRSPMMRGMFGAPPGRILVEADFSQAELRTLAHFSGDEFLRGVYAAGRDLHAEMAAAIFGKGFTKEQRTAAKTINFGIVYGLSVHGLSRQLSISQEEAQSMIDGWYARVPKVRKYLEDCRAAPLSGEVLTTPFGRKRRYGLILEENAGAVQREATNYAIQSVASDLALLSAIETQPKLAEMGALITNIVHDSVLVECDDHPEMIDAVARLLVTTMRAIPAKWLQTDVPFDADAKFGRHWGSMTAWKEINGTQEPD